jgi:hypothetical protein
MPDGASFESFQRELARLVDIFGHNLVSATDQQIDARVYELYGLTPEEIALVEGNA